MPRNRDLEDLNNLYIANNLLQVVTEHSNDDNSTTSNEKPSEDCLRVATLNMGSIILHKQENAPTVALLCNHMKEWDINILILTEVRTGFPSPKAAQLTKKERLLLLETKKK